jgi:Ca2+-binding RTX toxin-like protein
MRKRLEGATGWRAVPCVKHAASSPAAETKEGPMTVLTRSFNDYIDGVAGGGSTTKLTWTFGFAQNSDQARLGKNNPSFTAFNDIQQACFRTAIAQFSAVCNLTITETDITSNPDIVVGFDRHGQGWSGLTKGGANGSYLTFNTSNPNPTQGTYDHHNYMHELGHALGLRHGFEIQKGMKGVIPADHYGWNYSQVLYASPFVGGGAESDNQFQSLGLDDIRALQYLWGANFNYNSANTTYSWDPITGVKYVRDGAGATIKAPTPALPRVYEAIWDGGGIDTYDLSNFTKAQNIDLRPGYWSTISTDLLPHASDTTAIVPGNVANAYLTYDPDTQLEDLRSLIENVNAGSGNDTITGNQADNLINGNDGDDLIYGLTGKDTLNGGAGNDTLDGGQGADSMVGGAGDDTYYIDDVGDVVVENASGGNDTIISSVFISLQNAAYANFENLTLTGAQIRVAGSDSDNILTGNSADNIISGYGGADRLYGLDGDDSLDGGDGNDTLDGGAGNDTLRGGAGDDVYVFGFGYGRDTIIQGDGGADKLVLTAGVQATDITWSRQNDNLVGTLRGGADQITVINWFKSAANTLTVTLSDGSLLPVRLPQSGDGNPNTMIGTDQNDYYLGLGGDDSLTGGLGDDILDGGLGKDTMVGGLGNDIYIVDDINDVVIENANQGNDTVVSSITYTLNGTNLENLTLTGAANINATGNAVANILIGNDGNNIIDGLGGGDTMSGGKGNDTYTVYTAIDLVIENPGEGTDTVLTALNNYTLGANLENLTLLSSLTIKGSVANGNDAANIITGNAYDNSLSGGGGDDTIYGGGGNDTLMGGDGNDLLMGGDGNDSLQGGLGDDTLDGGAGNDFLGGNEGNNTYYFGKGYGTDTISRWGANRDKLIFNADVTSASEIKWSRDTPDSSDLTGTLTDGSKVILTSWFLGNWWQRLDVYLKDGTLIIPAVPINGTDQRDNLQSTDSNDFLQGFGEDDKLNGGAGNDTLDGGAGADTMTGGADNDTYIVDNVLDRVVETDPIGKDGKPVSQGDDTVVAYNIDFSLASYGAIENLTLIGAQKYVTGNALNNRLTGNDADNILNGGVGSDVMIGGKGNDIYYVDDLGDQVVENVGEGYDIVYSSVDFTIEDIAVEEVTLTGTTAVYVKGNALANKLTGNDADNIIIGGAGNDTMVGGQGDDLYYVQDQGDVVQENSAEGTDTVVTWLNNYTLSDNVENLTLVGDIATYGAPNVAITGSGNALSNYLLGNGHDNILYGYGGDDTLDGGYGADTLYGGIGDDTYIVDGITDVVFENRNEGVDTILTSLSTYRLGDYTSTGSFVENLTYTGAANFTGYGNLANNVITGGGGNDSLSGGLGDDTLNGGGGDDTLDGGAGNDVLQGGAGDDSMMGGAGDDTYYVGEIGDTVVELAGQGTDLVISGIADYTLANNVENLTLAATVAIKGSGNNLDNVIKGNALGNQLYGFGGNDSLDGGDGADMLDGGDGADTLIGGRAADTLYGGAGNDVYVFNRGDGLDTVSDDYRTTIQLDGGQDTLLFGANISQSDLWFTISGADLIIGLRDPANPSLAFASLTDKITLKNWFNTFNRIETIQFADNSTMTARQIVESLATIGNDTFTWVDTAVNLSLNLGNDNVTTGAFNDSIDGGGGNDTLTSGAGDDTLIGGQGNDILNGGLGNDVYIYNRGDGADTISDDGGSDVLSFGATITRDQLTFSLSGADLVISVTGTPTDKIILKNWTDPARQVETLLFADNPTLDARGIAELLVTAGNDTLTWTQTAINWAGGAGNDKLTTGAFNDTLTGGLGNDTLDGGAGYDIAVFSGAIGDYTVTKQANGSYTVTDKTGSRDGTDTLTNIEALRFSTGLYNIAGLTPVANTTPVLTSPLAATVLENVSTSTVIYKVAAFDPDPGAKLTYSILPGGDNAPFTIDANTGEVRFASSPNYESPTDNGGDHVYDFVVQASDGTRTATQPITITVGNVPESTPNISSGFGASADENVSTSTVVYKVVATDPENAALTYSLSGGADKGLFTIDASTGEVRFLASPDYESPSDADSNRRFEIEVAASNGVLTARKSVTITLNNVNEAPVMPASASISVAENTSAATSIYRVPAVDPEGASVAYSLSGGDDRLFFTIDPTNGNLHFNAPPDFEAKADRDHNNIYQIEVQASDGAFMTTETLSITVTNVNEAPTLTSPTMVNVSDKIAAGVTIFSAVATDPDATTTMTYSLGGSDSALFNIDARTGAVSFNPKPNYYYPMDKGSDNVYNLVVNATDGVQWTTQNVAITYAHGIEPNTVKTDFMGDAYSDIVLQRGSTGESYLWAISDNRLNDKGHVGWTPGPNWLARGTGDFNADGHSDLLLQNVNDGDCYIWNFNGKTLVDDGYVGWTPGPMWRAVATGDFNGDSRSDILLQNRIDGSCYVWELNNKSLVGDGYVGWTPGPGWQVKATGDFNGDGKSDILLQYAVDGTCYVWEMNNKLLVGDGYVGWTPGAAWQVKGTGDFDGDGKSDILLQNIYDGSCFVWEMNGLSVLNDKNHGLVGWTPGTDWHAVA